MTRKVLAFCFAALLAGVPALADDSRPAVIVTFENLAPTTGTFQTPIWIAFHGGGFDLYDLGEPASPELERLAEDGNTGPLMAEFGMSMPGAVQTTVLSNSAVPPLLPGNVVSRLLEVNPDLHHYFSFASMVIPSNDAFVGNGSPTAHEIFDDNGEFVAQSFIVMGSHVRDAGTEVNDELPPHTPLLGQMMPNAGIDEGGVVMVHGGLLPVGSGGVLDEPMFAGSDFTMEGYSMLRVSFTYIDLADSAKFKGSIDSDQSVPAPMVDSEPSGSVKMKFKEEGTVFSIKVKAKNLSGSLTGAHLHVGAAGSTGAVVVDLLAIAEINDEDGEEIELEAEIMAADIVGPLAGPGALMALIAELSAGGIYLNLHTEANPSGEARAQLYP